MENKCCNEFIEEDDGKLANFMRVQNSDETFDFDFENDIYYDKEVRGFKNYGYIGLYKDKSVRAIGKICARIIAFEKDNELVFESEYGEITDERKEKISEAIKDSVNHNGYDLKTIRHRYFFVDKFYGTDFKKESKGALQGAKKFDLSEYVGTEELPDTAEIANILNGKYW